MQPTRYAVAIALGPVGRFISAGRRSRDLWYGSRLLSELTHQVARYLITDKVGADLWTPRKESLHCFFRIDEVQPYQGPVISNKIRAIVPADTGEEIRLRLAQAEAKAREWLSGQLEEAAKKGLEPAIDLEAFRWQREAILQGDFIEFYAGYARVEDGDEHKALEGAQELRDARKSARLFVAPSWTQPGHSRSTMEPGRDSVQLHYPARARDPKAIEAYKTRQRLGIRSDERLDAIALLRRIAAMTQSQGPFQGEKILRRLPFPPLSPVAADPWIACVLASEAGRGDLAEIRRILWELELERKNDPALHLISSPSREPGDCRQDQSERDPANKGFPYDASFLFEGTLEALAREVTQTQKNLGEAGTGTALEKLREIEPPLRRLHRRFGAPERYYVLLTADGDGIGSILQECKTKDDEQALVEALDGFAGEAWTIVCAHHGVAFYVGGDELCAYLPVDRALEAAKALADAFTAAMECAAAKAREKQRPKLAEKALEGTLSVGLVVAHVKHDLRDIRERAEEALKAAKEARRKKKQAESWLRVIESTAGGVDRPCQGPTDVLVARIDDWVELLNDGALSMATAHGLLADLERYAADHDPRPKAPADTSIPEPDLERYAADHDPRPGIELALGNLLRRRERSGAAESHREVLREAHKTLCDRIQALRALLEDPADSTDKNALREARERALREARGLAHEVILAQRIAAAKALRTPRKKESR